MAAFCRATYTDLGPHHEEERCECGLVTKCQPMADGEITVRPFSDQREVSDEDFDRHHLLRVDLKHIPHK